jgi:uncharacterized protein with PIN domain
MSVRCPGCGREYDVTLFDLGRTISCTCGRVVGLEHRVARPAGRPPRFLADAMLGRLAVAEERVLLTRDRGIPREWWVDNCYVIDSDDPMVQLREVVERFGLEPRERLFSRCTLCNTPLQVLDATETDRYVPDNLRERHQRFVRCPSCGRLYWVGSHVDRMRKRLDEALAGEVPKGKGEG